MTYDEVSKALFNVGFTSGIRNMRKLEFECGRFIVAFQDKENITEIYFSVALKNSSESLYATIIKETVYIELENKLSRLIETLKPQIISFIEGMKQKLDYLKKSYTIEDWS